MGKLLGFPIGLVRMLTASATGVFFVPILHFVVNSIPIILTVWENADMARDAKFHPSANGETYDFIIVGAGASGAVVANRISKYFNVSLLEAGGELNPLQYIPAFTTFLINYPETTWLHKTVPQKSSHLNNNNQQGSYAAGKGLGGSGNIGWLNYLRGNPRDFDNWASITGDPSWSYEAVLPHFRKLENYGDRNADPRYHGFEGGLSAELAAYRGLGPEIVKAGQELGYPEIDVGNSHSEGFFELFMMTKNGVRTSPFLSYIRPARKRKTLTIRKYAFVTKILFREGNEEVSGVAYERHGKTYIATASKEVIISAGAVNTPKILMLSGVGPWEHLNEWRIPVRHNLPVGKNLQDKPFVMLNPIFIDPPQSVLLERDVTPKAFAQWFTGGRGVLSSSGTHATAVLSSSLAKARGEGNWPDIELYFFGFSTHKGFAKVFSKTFNLKIDEITKYYEHSIDKDSILVAVTGNRARSRGKIRLGGSGPHDELLIDPNYLNDPEQVDIRVLLEGIKTTLQVVENSTTFQNLNGRFTTQLLPGCEHLAFRSDEYWYCYIRRYTANVPHPSGTAAMGPRGSPQAVVDSELRVQGVRNLRVIDVSIFPTDISTTLQATAMMIGEKGATMILDYWNQNQWTS